MHFAHTGTSRKLAIIEALLIHSHPANVLLLETMLTAHMLAARQQQPCSSSRAWPLYFRSLLAPLGVPGDFFCAMSSCVTSCGLKGTTRLSCDPASFD